MKKIALLLGGLAMHTLMYAQIASLYAGLSGVVAKKSEVDVEVLTQIIVDKQQQLKKEFARRTILNQVNRGSYAFSSFANQSFDILFNTTNKVVASRKLIESSANLALSYGFTEFYLQASKKLLKNEALGNVFLAADSTLITPEERQKWLLYLSVASQSNDTILTAWDNKVLSGVNASGIFNTFSSILDSKKKAELLTVTDKTTDSIIVMVNNKDAYGKMLTEHPEMILQIYNKYNKIRPRDGASIYFLDKLRPANNVNTTYALNAILIDLVFDVLLNTEQVSGLGFYAAESNINREQYQSKSKYLSYISNYPNTTLSKALLALHERISGEVTLLFKTYTLIHDLAQKELSIVQMLQLYKPYRNDVSFKNSCDQLLSLQGGLKDFNQNIKGNFNLDTLITEANELFYRVKQMSISMDSTIVFNDGYKNSELLYITRKAYPIVTKLSFLINNVDKKYISALDTIYYSLLYANINYLNGQLLQQNQALAYQKITTFNNFVSLLTNLNDLDKASSYESILSIIQDAGAMFGNNEQAKAINSIVNNIEKYTNINVQDNTIDVDVESIILAIYGKYANQENHRLDFYFSIGLNQSFSLGDGFKNIALDTLNSFGFAVEKIGVKYKLINFKSIRSFEPGEKAPILFGFKKEITDKVVRSRVPIVSDIHLLAFGSGLLYNIVNTKTSEQFSSYLLGAGLGLSFYNGLDAHVCVNYPLGVDAPFKQVFDPNNSLYMFTFSLDIKIGEYLSALAQKQPAKK